MERSVRVWVLEGHVMDGMRSDGRSGCDVDECIKREVLCKFRGRKGRSRNRGGGMVLMSEA